MPHRNMRIGMCSLHNDRTGLSAVLRYGLRILEFGLRAVLCCAIAVKIEKTSRSENVSWVFNFAFFCSWQGTLLGCGRTEV